MDLGSILRDDVCCYNTTVQWEDSIGGNEEMMSTEIYQNCDDSSIMYFMVITELEFLLWFENYVSHSLRV